MRRREVKNYEFPGGGGRDEVPFSHCLYSTLGCVMGLRSTSQLRLENGDDGSGTE
jgi:hypothetical protein